MVIYLLFWSFLISFFIVNYDCSAYVVLGENWAADDQFFVVWLDVAREMRYCIAGGQGDACAFVRPSLL